MSHDVAVVEKDVETEMTGTALTIDDVINEITHVGGRVKRVYFAADIGNVGIDEINWIFQKDGQVKHVEMLRAAFEYEREPRVNFWLVNMAEPMAKMYGIADLAISDEEAAGHKERIAAGRW